MENKLKPKPCLFCGVTTRFFTDEQKAIAAWNRRNNEKR